MDEDRLQNESALYKIVNGIFTDPFIDVRPPEFKQKQNIDKNHQKQDAGKTNQTNLKKDVNKRLRNKSNNKTPKQIKKLKVNSWECIVWMFES